MIGSVGGESRQLALASKSSNWDEVVMAFDLSKHRRQQLRINPQPSAFGDSLLISFADGGWVTPASTGHKLSRRLFLPSFLISLHSVFFFSFRGFDSCSVAVIHCVRYRPFTGGSIYRIPVSNWKLWGGGRRRKCDPFRPLHRFHAWVMLRKTLTKSKNSNSNNDNNNNNNINNSNNKSTPLDGRGRADARAPTSWRPTVTVRFNRWNEYNLMWCRLNEASSRQVLTSLECPTWDRPVSDSSTIGCVYTQFIGSCLNI